MIDTAEDCWKERTDGPMWQIDMMDGRTDEIFVAKSMTTIIGV